MLEKSFWRSLLQTSDTEQPIPQPLRFDDIEIPVADQTPMVLRLLSVIQQLKKENQELRDEIQRLKGTARRPIIKPSVLLKPEKQKPKQPPGKRPGSQERSKTKDIRIDQDVVLPQPTCPLAQSWKATAILSSKTSSSNPTTPGNAGPSIDCPTVL